MSRQAPDLPLKRLVADLADHAPEDVEAILEALAPVQRERVRDLLDAYRGAPAAPKAKEIRPVQVEPEPTTDAPLALADLSPWLAHRLARQDNDTAPPFVMTPMASAALRAAVATLEPVAATRSIPPSQPHSHGAAPGFVGLLRTWRRRA